ncbi:hypothetical protein HGRIS_003009 [Hohenbuehelia grisea]|uniref:beta-N-acetylhexosaminidase n=1 Tax=Hohenbuehelia grisea TaxID=104357 RepID=A0ABR3JMQ9_9AGAR
MLDCGRQWYPADVLKDMCAYLGFFKASEFHLHLSDNLPGRVGADLNSTYARFRLRTDKDEFAGLTPHLNETYSKEEFDDLQASCAARGVTIVPEIEAPGHALVITQWKPHLALPSDPTLLNLSLPESTQTMQDVWREFLPWFHTKEVSIGADEYSSALADDYIRFAGNMSEFIQKEANKTIRLWGTNEPSRTGLQLTRDLIVQHWEGSEDNAFQLIQQGYRVINSDDFFNYIVIKQSGSFPQRLNQTRLWKGNARGGPWDPTQFNRTVSAQPNNPPPTSPLLRGGIMAAWNDQGPTASTPLEAFYSFKMGLPVVAAAGWRAATQPGALSQAQFNSVFEILQRAAPGQNLDRRVPSRGPTVLEFNFTATAGTRDLSGNGYDARLSDGASISTAGLKLTSGATVDTPLTSKGANYTLLLSFSATAPRVGSTATLLSGPDTTLVLSTSSANTTFAFISSNITYALTSFALPKGAGTTEVVLRGTEETVNVAVNGTSVGAFETVIRNSAVRKGMAFVAPIAHIGGPGFEGVVKRLVVFDGIANTV